MTDQRALVTGATGAIGPALVNHLSASGYKVRIYNQHSADPSLFTGDVEHVLGDVRDKEMLAQALQDVDVVFHLAALLHIENPSPEIAPLYQQINVDGTQQVADQASQAGVRRMVFFSTVKVYGIHRRDPVSEEVGLNPKTIYAQTKVQAEQIVNSSKHLETVVLRLSPVYGPRLRGSWERMVKAIAKGRFIPIGSLQNERSLTYVDDVAQAARFVGEHPNAIGNTYNLVGYDAITMREILSAIYAAFNKPMPPIRIPAIAALAGVHLLDAASAITGKQLPINTETLQQLFIDEVYSGAKLRSLGFEAAVSLGQGWTQTVAALNKR